MPFQKVKTLHKQFLKPFLISHASPHYLLAFGIKSHGLSFKKSRDWEEEGVTRCFAHPGEKIGAPSFLKLIQPLDEDPKALRTCSNQENMPPLFVFSGEKDQVHERMKSPCARGLFLLHTCNIKWAAIFNWV